MSTVLYITYDGLLDPLGMSQVWQYQKKLGKDHNIIILSFEKKTNPVDICKLKDEVKSNNVTWIRLKYHKSPTLIATTYDIFYGFFTVLKLIKKNKINFIHSRSYVATVIAYLIHKRTNLDYIFDMRGFWADEKIDGGVWKKSSFIYNFIKYVEKNLLSNAKQIVTLTYAGKKDIKHLGCVQEPDSKISVIPTCANLDVFKPVSMQDASVKGDVFLLGYTGSVGTFYMFDEVLKSFKSLVAVKKKSKLLIINKGQHDYIKSRISLTGMSDFNIEIKTVDYHDMAKEIQSFDAGIYYIKPSFSKRSSSPTRLAELLGCGKPCITNYGVGDTEEMILNEKVGVILKDFSINSHNKGVEALLTLVNNPETSVICAKAAKKYYSLNEGVEKYNELYYRMPNAHV